MSQKIVIDGIKAEMVNQNTNNCHLSWNNYHGSLAMACDTGYIVNDKDQEYPVLETTLDKIMVWALKHGY